MVIQSNMTTLGIVSTWEETREIFQKYNVPIDDHSLDGVVEDEMLPVLLEELNHTVGSSKMTCVNGG